jgi:hypothetical protein
MRGGAENDDALLMMQACTMLYTPKLEVDSPEHGAGILVLTGV